jgi:uncharacterized membrane protein YkvA (DUF1232 family)
VPEKRIEIDLSARERRIYDRLRAHVVRLEPNARSGLRDLMLLLPDLAILLFRLIRDPRVPPGSKLIAMLGVSYAVSPIDLMPAILVGPLGLMDDLIVVSAALSRILNHVHPDLVRSHWPGQGDALDAIRRVSGWSESVVGRTLARVLGFRQIGA